MRWQRFHGLQVMCDCPLLLKILSQQINLFPQQRRSHRRRHIQSQCSPRALVRHLTPACTKRVLRLHLRRQHCIRSPRPALPQALPHFQARTLSLQQPSASSPAYRCLTFTPVLFLLLLQRSGLRLHEAAGASSCSLCPVFSADTPMFLQKPLPESWFAAAAVAQAPHCSSSPEAVLGVDSNGAIAVWERRGEGDGLWSGGRLIELVQEAGRVHSACLLSDCGDRSRISSSKHLVMLCGSDRACVYDLASRSKVVVRFCALTLQVTAAVVVMVAPSHSPCSLKLMRS